LKHYISCIKKRRRKLSRRRRDEQDKSNNYSCEDWYSPHPNYEI